MRRYATKPRARFLCVGDYRIAGRKPLNRSILYYWLPGDVLRRIIWLKFGGRDVHLPRLIGVFLLVFSVLMLVKACAIMIDSWDGIQRFNACEPDQRGLCGEALWRITGVSIWAGQTTELNDTQFWAALLGPVANVFFWLIVLLVGVIFYKSGNLVLPIEESVREVAERRRK